MRKSYKYRELKNERHMSNVSFLGAMENLNEDIRIFANDSGRRTVFINAGDKFGGHIYEVLVDIPGEFFYCKNQNPFHPNIEYGKKYMLGLRISKDDLADHHFTLSAHTNSQTIIALKDLIQNPRTDSPWNLDASVLYCRNPEMFVAKQREFALNDPINTPFGSTSYTVVKNE